jgi:hypothetical protein
MYETLLYFFLILREKVYYATEPIEAELHKRKLSLLYSMLGSDNSKIREIINRQISVNYDNRTFSFVTSEIY